MDHPQDDPPARWLGVAILVAIMAVAAALLNKLLGR
jgi:hypothetical protein